MTPQTASGQIPSGISPEDWEEVCQLAARLKRSPTETLEDLRLVAYFERDICAFAEFFFSVGKGWLYPGKSLTEYQKETLRRLASGTPKTLDLIPRGHMKTTLVRIFILWCIVYKKTALVDNILVLAGSDDNKQGYRDALQSALTNHLKFDRFHWFFAYWFEDGKPIEKDNQDFLKLTNGLRIFYRSILSKNRGLNIEGRPDLIILDDIYGDDARESEAIRERITDIMVSAVEFLGETGARYRGVGTPIHPDDFWWKIAKGDIGGWDVRVLEAHNDSFGDILWPDRYPNKQAFITLQEQVYIPAGRMHLYNAELRCNPTTATNTPFANIIIKRYRAVDPQSLYRVMGVDNAGGKGGDNFTIVEVGASQMYEIETEPGVKEKRFNKYLLDVFAQNMISLAGKYQALEARIDRRRPHLLVIGATSESADFIQGFDLYMKSRGKFIPIFEYKEVTDKNERIVGRLAYEYTAQTILHPEITHYTPWCAELESELRSFDKSRKNQKDDRLDPLAKCLHMIRAAEPQDTRPPRPEDEILGELYDDLHGLSDKRERPKLKRLELKYW